MLFVPVFKTWSSTEINFLKVKNDKTLDKNALYHVVTVFELSCDVNSCEYVRIPHYSACTYIL